MATKHSIIVGGTKGVGRELAALWARDGQNVTAVGRKPGEFPAFSGGGRIVGFPGDVEQPEALLQALRGEVHRHGKLSSLVFLQRYRGSGDSWTGELNVALNATRVLIEGLADDFASDGDRSIVIVTSNAGTFIERKQSLAYHTSKAALRQMARYYAVKLGERGIRVNTVAPCAFIKQESAAFYQGQAALRELYGKITPLGRMGTAAEVAEAVAFLCSARASFITGQELGVDGGLSLRLHDALAREVTGVGA
jgi:NAD(P)-dependent dehydrogenase (short-subunit alcohol dehydrogenase family)